MNVHLHRKHINNYIYIHQQLCLYYNVKCLYTGSCYERNENIFTVSMLKGPAQNPLLRVASRHF